MIWICFSMGKQLDVFAQDFLDKWEDWKKANKKPLAFFCREIKFSYKEACRIIRESRI